MFLFSDIDMKKFSPECFIIPDHLYFHSLTLKNIWCVLYPEKLVVFFDYFMSHSLVSTYVVCERLSVMHKQVSGWTVNFCPNFPESPFQESQTRKPPLHHFGKVQIWDDQSLLWNPPPPIWKSSDLRWPNFTLESAPPFWKTSDLRWPKFTTEYPPTPHFGKCGISYVETNL